MAYFDHIKDEIKKEAKKKWGYDLPDKKPMDPPRFAQSYPSQQTQSRGTASGFEFLKQKAIEAREELQKIKEGAKEEQEKEDFIPKGDVRENPIIDNRFQEQQDVQQFPGPSQSFEPQKTPTQNPFQEQQPSSQPNPFQQRETHSNSQEQFMPFALKEEKEEFSFQPRSFEPPQSREPVARTTEPRNLFEDSSPTQNIFSLEDLKESDQSTLLEQIKEQNKEIIRMLKKLTGESHF